MIQEGQLIELTDGSVIIVAKVKETADGIVVVSTDGEIYTESEMNIEYRLAPEYILYNEMYAHGIDINEYDKDMYESVYFEFIKQMKMAGYIEPDMNLFFDN